MPKTKRVRKAGGMKLPTLKDLKVPKLGLMDPKLRKFKKSVH